MVPEKKEEVQMNAVRVERANEAEPEKAESASSRPKAPRRGRGEHGRSPSLLAVLILIVAVITSALAWVVASPVGASPDEDYHLGAMWCPPPVDETGCQIGTKNGQKAVIVPQTLAKENVTCYAFEHDNSARCTFAYSDDLTATTLRWDDGNYPWGYYQFAHLFVQHSTNRAVLALRVFNTLLAIGLLGAIIALADSELRSAISVALTIAWLPMGFYFIASMNPSSWAISGTFAFASAMLAATRSAGPRRAGLIACALAGAVLACTSRGDSAFFLFVVTVALAFAVPLRRRIIPEAVVASIASVVGVVIMLRTNVSSKLVPVEASAATVGRRAILLKNLAGIPDYLRGFVGYRLGPGWNDVTYQGGVRRTALAIVIVLICWALAHLSWRRALSALVVLGAIVGVPVTIGVQGRFNNVEIYQPRYMLPLFAVFLLMLLAPSPARSDHHRRGIGAMPLRPPSGIFGRLCVGVVATLWALTYARALYLIIERYAFGWNPQRYPIDLSTRNLSTGYEWWWPGAPIGPMAVWIIASLCACVAVALMLYLWNQSAIRERIEEQ